MFVLFVTQALAQTPIPFNLGGPDPADRWVVADVASERFPGETLAGPTFTAGEEVQLILAENGRARIRAGDRYGWVAVAAITDQAPAGASAPLALPAGGASAGGASLLGGVPQLPK